MAGSPSAVRRRAAVTGDVALLEEMIASEGAELSYSAAAECGQIETLTWLQRRRAPRRSECISAAAAAAAEGQTQVLDWLARACPRHWPYAAREAATTAAECGRNEVLRQLHGSNELARCVSDVYVAAARARRTATLDWLWSAEMVPDANAQALIVGTAVCAGDVETLRWLGSRELLRASDVSNLAYCARTLPTIDWLIAHGATLKDFLGDGHGAGSVGDSMLGCGFCREPEGLAMSVAALQRLSEIGVTLDDYRRERCAVLADAAVVGDCAVLEWLAEQGMTAADFRVASVRLLAERNGQRAVLEWLSRRGIN